MNSREIAYLALLKAMREESFISETLSLWFAKENPSKNDFNLSQEIACGSMRMQKSLEHIILPFLTNGKMQLKPKERALLYCALYQYVYLNKIPLFAITNESINIAKKYLSRPFSGFLNALMRKLATVSPSELLKNLPQGNSITELAINYSQREEFVERLLAAYPLGQVKEILAASNLPSSIHARVRNSNIAALPISKGSPIESAFGMIRLHNASDMEMIVNSPHYYIQNATPWILMNCLAKNASYPKSILDVCAAPGGKLLAAHDLFPNASLTANDVGIDKIERLQENCRKYAVNAKITAIDGRVYPNGNLYDLVIIDAPCSNTGVLNKRPEARWRLNNDVLKDLREKQYALLKNAVDLISQNGEIWFLTCSILPEENETFIAESIQKLPLTMRHQELILPTTEGYDGGYGCALRKR